MSEQEAASGATMTVAEYGEQAEAWLSERAGRRGPTSALRWGEGSDNVAVFHNMSATQERACVDDLRAWQRLKSDAGFGSITWPVEYGGAGLPKAYEVEFTRRERQFVTPPGHEAVTISLNIEAPSILSLGTDAQRRRWVASLRRCDEMCCQLFSEPAAGSDLGAISLRAERDGDEWVVNGQKVWTSGAQFADVGYLIARTDADAPRQQAMTAFLVAMDAPGVEVRPLRQMSGGSSFNEVFFTDVRVPDSMRLGAAGDGWHVALTTLGFERDRSAQTVTGRVGGSWPQLLATARAMGVTGDPSIRQRLAVAYTHERIERYLNRRLSDLVRAGGTPGPEGSLGKLLWTNGMTLFSDVVGQILGPSLVADTGAWGTYAWGEHVLGAPGYRIAGGSDEIQRNIIGERVLGLPPEPRVDKDLPFSAVLALVPVR